jgi:hypothetical protein
MFLVCLIDQHSSSKANLPCPITSLLHRYPIGKATTTSCRLFIRRPPETSTYLSQGLTRNAGYSALTYHRLQSLRKIRRFNFRCRSSLLFSTIASNYVSVRARLSVKINIGPLQRYLRGCHALQAFNNTTTGFNVQKATISTCGSQTKMLQLASMEP